ncbi:MAG: porin [Bacteroidaceae bacterium]|nr:porin [Bacteroidaceae bacterium]
MKKNIVKRAIGMLAALALNIGMAWSMADDGDGKTGQETSEFEPQGVPGEGFLTALANHGIENAMEASDGDADGKMRLGRHVTDYISAPKVGGYFIGKYGWTDQASKHSGDGFSQRLIRFYVDGTVLKDLKYRIQIQANNASFHMKDYFVEWAHWKEFAVKLGQYKRAFLFENPYNPWDVGVGDYSQLVKKFSGMGDYCGEGSANGGRDQGLQLQGDLLPCRRDGHRFLHYQLQLMNGQGINASDQNRHKDFIGTLQVQPVKDLFVGFFGWTGNYEANGVTVNRDRWALAAKYEHKDWSARVEYARSKGHKVSEWNAATNSFAGRGRADGWYATAGVPCTKWLKVYLKYDAFRDQATWQTLRTIYSLAPNVQIHKNLMLQLQYNYVHDRTVADRDYNELWAEAYVRF